MPNLRTMLLFLPGLAGVVGLCGCASVHVSGYYAFGDSITYGGYLPDRESQAYPFLVAKVENFLATNHAISGDEACDIPARQIFPNSQNPFLASATVSFILIGNNDANNHGAGAYEAVFIECHLSAVSWQAVPAGTRCWWEAKDLRHPARANRGPSELRRSGGRKAPEPA